MRLRNLFQALLISTVAISLSGCKGRALDTIKLSAHEITVNADAQTVTVTTESTKWIYEDIIYGMDNGHTESVPQGCHNNSIHPTFDFSGLWFSVSNSDNRKIFYIDLQTNDTGQERYVTVKVWCGDFFDSFTVTQKAKR